MHHFTYQEGVLCCEDVRIEEVVSKIGSPLYLYSAATLSRHYRIFDACFADLAHLTCFAVKSCPNLGVLSLLGRLGSGADIVSGGELYRAMRAGIDPQRIVFSGVGKTVAEMREALYAGILLFNCESSQELERLQQVAAELGTRARVALRVNPDVDPQTHSYIATGLAQNKFGISMDNALAIYRRARDLANIEVIGLSCHIGSQLTQLAPFIDALRKLKVFIGQLASEGIGIRYLDLGGGIGITYDQEAPPHPQEYAHAIRAEIEDLDCTLIFEPGRIIVGNAGILVTEVQYIKTRPSRQGSKRFVIVDAAMNDLARPSLYGAFHEIRPVRLNDAEPLQVDIVGPICESGDFIARDRLLAPVRQGDLLAVMSCGAYGFSMASNYNSRPRAAEVLVAGASYHVVRRREDYDDLIRGEATVEII